ncbi:hypothetical protein LTR85_002676 [Meristemomyces frigidus]|nr:hypothetical protein LTR85_002676 [Meristemomyces frigidus]
MDRHLLDFPPEVRQMMLATALFGEEVYFDTEPAHIHQPDLLGIVLVNKQIRDEAEQLIRINGRRAEKACVGIRCPGRAGQGRGDLGIEYVRLDVLAPFVVPLEEDEESENEVGECEESEDEEIADEDSVAEESKDEESEKLKSEDRESESEQSKVEGGRYGGMVPSIFGPLRRDASDAEDAKLPEDRTTSESNGEERSGGAEDEDDAEAKAFATLCLDATVDLLWDWGGVAWTNVLQHLPTSIIIELELEAPPAITGLGHEHQDQYWPKILEHVELNLVIPIWRADIRTTIHLVCTTCKDCRGKVLGALVRSGQPHKEVSDGRWALSPRLRAQS